MPSDPMVTTQWLADHLDDPGVRIVDASWYFPSEALDGAAEFAKAHIPGAVFFDIDEIADAASALPHMLPQPAAFAAAATALGLGSGATIVVYDQLGMRSAARVWWSFRAMGHDAVHVLDGGLPKWIAEGRPVAAGAAAPAAAAFVANRQPQLILDQEQVRALVERGGRQILDARPGPRFLGEEPEPRAGLRSGHMPGAVSLPMSKILAPGGGLQSESDLQRIFAEAGINIDGPLATTCGSGITAAGLALALARLGRWDVPLYDGSWAEWGACDDTPVLTGTPARANDAAGLPIPAAEALAGRFGARFSQAAAIRQQHAGIEAHQSAVHPDAVVMALTVEDVVDAIRICRTHGAPIIAHGAGTALEGHLSAIHGGVSLDLMGLDAILEVDADNLLCQVEAGVTREQLNQHLRAQGLFFPLDPGANATLGGMAATGASGTNAVRYGTMRDNVLSLQVVLEDGRVVETGTRAAKSSAGYDLSGLFVGSEGTLGVITNVTLRLHPIPETVVAATCHFPDLDSAVRVVIAAIQMGVPMARIELLDAAQVAACNAYSKLSLAVAPTLFLEFHGSPAGVAEQVGQMRELIGEYAGSPLQIAERAEDRSQLWKARHEAYFAAQSLRPNSWVWSTDVCVPIAALADSIAQTRADLDAHQVTATIVGHVGDGNYHVLFVLDPTSSDEMAQASAINARMVARAIAVHGTCTGEHGVGTGKRESLLKERGPDAVGLMAAIKKALDPTGLLNPGKIFEPC